MDTVIDRAALPKRVVYSDSPLVLFAVACRAGWNAAIKIGSDTLSTTALIAIGAGIVGVALLPFVGAPSQWQSHT
jgi:hypothetical protein